MFCSDVEATAALRSCERNGESDPGGEGCMRASAVATSLMGRLPGESQVQNRAWEIRPSGIVGGLRESRPIVEMGSHPATERAGLVTLHLPVRALDFYPSPTARCPDLKARRALAYPCVGGNLTGPRTSGRALPVDGSRSHFGWNVVVLERSPKERLFGDRHQSGST